MSFIQIILFTLLSFLQLNTVSDFSAEASVQTMINETSHHVLKNIIQEQAFHSNANTTNTPTHSNIAELEEEEEDTHAESMHSFAISLAKPQGFSTYNNHAGKNYFAAWNAKKASVPPYLLHQVFRI